MPKSEIPLIRAAVMEPVIQAAYSINSPVEEISNAVKFPLHALEYPEKLIAEVPGWHFIDAVTRREGDHLFGLRIGRTSSFQDISTMRPLLVDCFSLNGLLKRFCQTAHLQSSSSNYRLEEDGDLVWFLQRDKLIEEGAEQIELFEISGMMQLVQLAAGKNWRPIEIHLRTVKNRHIENASDLNPSRIHYSKSYPAIAIPRHLLTLPVPYLTSSTDGATLSLREIPTQFYQKLLIAIMPYLGSKKVSQEVLPDITGVSFRTLQRRLKNDGTSLSNIMAQARFIKAKELMSDSKIKLLEIALQLGYENASAFTRAFKHWTNMAPKEYRKLHTPAGIKKTATYVIPPKNKGSYK